MRAIACRRGCAPVFTCFLVVCLASSTARGQTVTSYLWSGATSTDFSITTNWTTDTVAPTGGSFTDSRITVGTGSTAPTRELIYSAAQGTTTYTNTGTTNQSGLFIGAFSGTPPDLSASMRITGGSFTSSTERADGMASGGNGTLTIAGGSYTKTGSNSDFAVKWAGDGTGTLNVESGSFTAGRIVYGLFGTGGAGVVNLSGGTTTVNQILESSTTSSTLNLNGGTLRAGANQNNFIAVDTARVSAGGARIDTQGFAVTIAQALLENPTSTGGSLTKLGAGTLTLSAANTYSGGTTISAGELIYSNLSALGGGTVGFTGNSTLRTGIAGTLANALSIDSNVTATLNTQAFSVALSGLVTGAGGIRKNGAGTLTLSGSNSYSGSTTIVAGTLVVGANNALGGTTGGTLLETTTSDAAALQLANGVTVSETLTIRRGGSTATPLGAVLLEGMADANAEWAGEIRLGNGGEPSTSVLRARIGHLGNGTLTVSGQIVDDVNGSASNLVILGQQTGVVRISGTSNTYSGATSVARGILQLGATNALPTATILDVALNSGLNIAATFDLGGFSQTLGGLLSTASTGTADALIRNTGATLSTLTVNQAATTEFAGKIQDQVALVKTGTGTLTLSGSNSYTGATTINAGTLVVGANGGLGGTAGGTRLESTTSTAAALQLANGVTVSETLTIQRGGSSLAPLGIAILEGVANANAEWAGQVRLGNGGDPLVINLLGRFGHLGNGTLTLSGQIVDDVPGSASNLGVQAQATGVVRISGTSNTYTGATNVFRGTLRLGATDALPTATILDVHRNNGLNIAAAFDLNGFSQTIGELKSSAGAGTAAASIINTAGTLSTLTVNQASTTEFAGSILDQVAFVKQGTGRLTLSGSNSYTGSTTISGGTLALASTGGLTGAGTISIAAAGTFNVSAQAGGFALGSGQAIGGAGTVLGSLFFDTGSSLVFSETETLALSSGTASFFAGTAGSRFGIDNLIGISSSTPLGTYTLIAGTVDFTNLDNVGAGAAFALGGGVSAYFQEGSLQVVVVPEPGRVGLAAAAAVAALLAVRRRR